MRGAWFGWVAWAVAVSVPGVALAGGYEYGPAGARPMGRAGAAFTRADDPMVLLYNPANLAALEGSQIMLNAQLAVMGACATRGGTYGEPWAGATTTGGSPPDDWTRFGDPDGFYDTAFPELCNGGPPSPGGSALVFTHRLSDSLGLGVGLFTPPAVGHTLWGEEDGAAGVANLPSPYRYILVEEQLITVYPTVGIGFSPLPILRIGATLQSSFALYNFDKYSVANPGEDLAGDLRSNLSVADWFVPRVSLSAQLMPMDGLDVSLTLLWADTAKATGTLEIVAQDFIADDRRTTELEDVSLTAPQMSWAALAVRYADRVEGATGDALESERWDVELAAVYELNSRIDELVIDIPAGQEIVTAGGTLDAPTEVLVPHNWKNQLSVRLGGDYALLPGRLALRAGAAFETRGLDPTLAQIDFMPVQRISLALGATVRFGALDLSGAYMHVIQETIEVSGADAALRQTAALGEGVVVNAGTYSSSFDAIAITASYHL